MGITDSGLCYKRMLFKSLIFIALAAAALAQTAPEETFVEETFNAASTHVENFMQEETEARKSPCVKAADASINNVYTEVKTSQKFLNSLPNGRTCASRNQHLIAKARRWIKTCQSRLHAAKRNLKHARRTRIDWDFSFESLRVGQCHPFFRSGRWQSVKRTVNHRSRQVAGAQATLRSAHSNLRNTIAAAKRAVNQCKCGIMDKIRTELATARRLTPNRKKTILREMMVKCLVAARKHGKNANKAAAKCKSIRLSAAVIRRIALHHPVLARGVNRARCSAAVLRRARSERQVKRRAHYARLAQIADKRAEKAAKENHAKRVAAEKKKKERAKKVAAERKAKAKARELARKERYAKAVKAREQKAKKVARERGAKVRAERARKVRAR